MSLRSSDFVLDSRSAGWEQISSHSGCDYYIRQDATSSLRQAKTVTTTENASPDECLAFLLGTTHLTSSRKPTMIGGKKVKKVNDHSDIVQLQFKFPTPMYNRDLVYKSCWKRMRKDTVVLIMTSTTEEAPPKEHGFVRMELKFGVYVLEGSSGLGTKITHFLCVDPMGYIPSSLVRSYVMHFTNGPSEVRDYFSTKEDTGLPLLQRLLERRLSRLSKQKKLLLGYAAVMGGTIQKASELVEALKAESKQSDRRDARSLVDVDSMKLYKDLADLVRMHLLEGDTITDTDIGHGGDTRYTGGFSRHGGESFEVSHMLESGSDIVNIGSFSVRFVHKYVHDCCLNMLPEKHFMLANKVAADLISSRTKASASRFEHHHYELARLYRNCGEFEEARLNFIMAGNSAMNHGAVRDASRMYFQLIELGSSLAKDRLPLTGFHR